MTIRVVFGWPSPVFFVGRERMSYLVETWVGGFTRPDLTFWGDAIFVVIEGNVGTLGYCAAGNSAYAMPVRLPTANSNMRRFDPSRLALSTDPPRSVMNI